MLATDSYSNNTAIDDNNSGDPKYHTQEYGLVHWLPSGHATLAQCLASQWCPCLSLSAIPGPLPVWTLPFRPVAPEGTSCEYYWLQITFLGQFFSKNYWSIFKSSHYNRSFVIPRSIYLKKPSAATPDHVPLYWGLNVSPGRGGGVFTHLHHGYTKIASQRQDQHHFMCLCLSSPLCLEPEAVSAWLLSHSLTLVLSRTAFQGTLFVLPWSSISFSSGR